LTNDDVLWLDSGHTTENTDLLVTNVFSGEGDWALHGEEGKNLKQVCGVSAGSVAGKKSQRTVLHNITDDTKLVEVTTSALGTEWLLEGDLDVVNVVAVPGGAEELVAEAEDEDVLDHLLTQVVVDTEDLLFLPVWLKSGLQLSRTAKVLTEWLLDL